MKHLFVSPPFRCISISRVTKFVHLKLNALSFYFYSSCRFNSDFEKKIFLFSCAIINKKTSLFFLSLFKRKTLTAINHYIINPNQCMLCKAIAYIKKGPRQD